MNFNIDALERSSRATFDHVVGHQPGQPDEAGKPTRGAPVGFRLVGTGSDEYSDAMRQIALIDVKEAAQRSKAAGEVGAGDAAGLDASTDAGAALVVDSSKQRREIIARRCIVGWFGWTIGEGDNQREAEFTPDNLNRVLASRPAWLYSIVAAVENDANFISG